VQPLHDETLAAEQAGAEPLLKRDADADALGRAQEGVLLHDQLAAQVGEVQRDDLAGVGGAEGHLFFARALVHEHGHEEGFAGEQALARAEQGAHETRVLLRSRRRRSSPSRCRSSIYIMPPASATTASCGSSSTSTNCMSSPWIL
jgi:hypothetical protein